MNALKAVSRQTMYKDVICDKTYLLLTHTLLYPQRAFNSVGTDSLGYVLILSLSAMLSLQAHMTTQFSDCVGDGD